MVLARAILWLLTLGFAGFGAAYAFWPTAMAAMTDITLPTASAQIDFVATYSGLQLGLATFLGLCARRDAAGVRSGLLASGCALLGLAIARASALLWSDDAGSAIYAGVAIEVVGAALAFWGHWRTTAYGSAPRVIR